MALEAQIAARALARSAARATRSADIEEIDRADYAQLYSILNHANLSEAISASPTPTRIAARSTKPSMISSRTP